MFLRALIMSIAMVSLFSSPLTAETPKARLGNATSLKLNEDAVALLHEGKTDQAIKKLKEALMKDHHNLSAAYNLAGVYLSQKQEQKAIDVLTPFEQNKVSDPGIYRRLADSYFSAQNPTKAKALYKKAIDLDADHAVSYLKLAAIQIMTGEEKKAHETLSSCVKRFPENRQALSNLASLELSLGNYQQAVSTAKASLQVAPDPQSYLTLGAAYEALKEYNEALIAYRRARDTGSKDPALNARIKELSSALKK